MTLNGFLENKDPHMCERKSRARGWEFKKNFFFFFGGGGGPFARRGGGEDYYISDIYI